jgi:uncharacterized protein (TIGR02145 family)
MRTKILVLFALALLLSANLLAQVTIGGLTTPKAGALLDLNSTTQGGLLLSNVDLPDLSVIPGGVFVNIPTTQDSNPELAGMIVYNTYEPTGVGVYVWDGEDWIKPSAPPAPGPITFSDTNICGTGLTFTAGVAAVNGSTSYVWELPAGLSVDGAPDGATITVKWTTEGVYPASSITVRAMNSYGAGSRRASAQAVTVGAKPAEPTNPSSATINSSQLFTFSASVPSGHEIDWYDVPSGGTIKQTGDSFEETVSATKTYFAESRNTTTGCVSDRLPVTATLTITGCIPGTFDLTGKVAFVSDDTTATRYGRIFSAPVKITASKVTYNGGSGTNNQADYRDHSNGTDTYGSWFSWCMVAQYGNVLCPSPWRVPSSEDFCQYINNNPTTVNITSTIRAGVHGWLRGGRVSNTNVVSRVNSNGDYWSSTPRYGERGWYATVDQYEFAPSANSDRNNGFSLRCVKTAQ